MDRKAELERKRQKLADLRRAREKGAVDSRIPPPTSSVPEEITEGERSKDDAGKDDQGTWKDVAPRDPKDLDEWVLSLLHKSLESPSSSFEQKQEQSLERETEQEWSSPILRPSFHSTLLISEPSTLQESPQHDIFPEKLVSAFENITLDLPPKEIFMYEKSIQTEIQDIHTHKESIERPHEGSSILPPSQEPLNKAVQTNMCDLEETFSSKQRKAPNLSTFTEDDRKRIVNSEVFSGFVQRTSTFIERALSDSYHVTMDYAQIENNVDEQNEDHDVDDDQWEGGEEEFRSRPVTEGVQLVMRWMNDRVCKGRIVTHLDTTPRHRELVLAAYNSSTVSLNDPDGLAVIWNLHLRTRPEYQFQSPSPVLTALFHPTQTNLVMGSTYSGQVLLWDMRAKSLPVQKSLQQLHSGHQFPVYCMQWLQGGSSGYARRATGGSTGSIHELVTVSTDGRMCTWQLERLSQPVTVVDWIMPPSMMSGRGGASSDLPVCSMDIPQRNTSTLLLGGEDGCIYQVDIAERLAHVSGGPLGNVSSGTLSGTMSTQTTSPSFVYRGHQAPILSLHCHPEQDAMWVRGSSDPMDSSSGGGDSEKDGSMWIDTTSIGELFLTCSTDWTIKLWQRQAQSTMEGMSTRSTLSTHPTISPTISFFDPLYTFETGSYEPIYDVQWSPLHPAVFASVDAGGRLSIWNLNSDVESPLVSIPVPEHPLATSKREVLTSDGSLPPLGSFGSTNNPSSVSAAYRLRWDPLDGEHIWVASADGGVYMYRVADLFENGPTENGRLRQRRRKPRGGGNGFHNLSDTRNVATDTVPSPSTTSTPAHEWLWMQRTIKDWLHVQHHRTS